MLMNVSLFAEFLAKRGEGVHHLCFGVEDIDAALARVRRAGLPVVGEAPRPGAGGCRVAFLRPNSTGGVLVELSEKPPGKPPGKPSGYGLYGETDEAFPSGFMAQQLFAFRRRSQRGEVQAATTTGPESPAAPAPG